MNPQTDPTLNSIDPNGFGPAQTATPTEVVKSPSGQAVTTGQIGKSGTFLFNGIITREEYNPDLMRWELLKNIDIMRRSDATIKAALKVVKLPILSTTWRIEAASDDPQDIEIADWVRFNLFDNIDFPSTLSEVLTFLEFGYSVFEKVWDYVQWQPNTIVVGKDEDGNPIEKIQPKKTMIGLAGLESRKQRSIYRWKTNDETPVFGITQYVPGGTYSIPGDKLAVFTLEREGENYEGISLLRPAYKHWRIKDKLELIEAVRHERQGLGIIEVVPPEGANEDDINMAIDSARQVRASEEGVIKHPNGWTMQFMDMKSGTSQLTDIQSTLEYHKREIMKSVLAQFLELGGNKGGSGSKATSADQSSLFDDSEEYTAKYIGNVFNQFVIRELVDLNYSNVKNYPTLEHGKIGDDSLTEIGTVVNQLMTAGALTADPQFEQWIRQQLHAPALPDDMVENYENLPSRQKAPTIVPAAPVNDPNAPPVELPIPGDPNDADKETPDKSKGDIGDKSDEQTKTAADAVAGLVEHRRKVIDVLLG